MNIIAQNYYDLISGLPDIFIDEPGLPVSSAALIDEMSALVAEDDARLLNIIRLPVDNKNLITVLESRDRPFERGGNYTQELLLQEIKSMEALPEYMHIFIAAHRQGQQLFPGLTPEDQLNWLFYDGATAHENEFIADWFTFELNLRNVLAALSIRSNLSHLKDREPEYERCLASAIICRNDVAERIFKSNASDFGLASLIPWIENVLLFSAQDIAAREKSLDRLRWEMLEELTTFTYFTIETILACSIKLMMVERWIKLDPVTGRQKLEQLVAEIQEGFK